MTFAETRQLNAAARAAVLDAVGADLPVDIGQALAAEFEEWQRQIDYAAGEYKEDTEWPPPRKNH